MAAKTKAQLLADIVAKFPDNTTGIISELIMREVSTDWVDSLASALGASFFGTQEGNALETVINTAGVYEAANIIITPDAGNVDFTVAGGVVTYTGTLTKRFLFSKTISGNKVGPGAADVSMKVYKNGTTQLPGQCVQKFLSGDPTGLGVSAVVSLATNDTIEAKVANLTDTDNVLESNTLMAINEWV